MATVYLAVENKLGRNVAIKVLHQHLKDDANLCTRFMNEAKIMATLNHRSIVRVIAFEEFNGNYAIVMDYVEGQSLDNIIENECGPIPQERTLPIIISIIDGVNYAHKHGVIHRDLKPSNVLVSKEGNVLVNDFGIARIMNVERMTKTGTQMGSPCYMSPEQITGMKIDERSDIFSLGMSLYEMLAGRLPFTANEETTEFAIMNSIVQRAKPYDPRNFYPHIAEWLVRVIQKATALDPGKRFQNCDEFLSALKNEGSLLNTMDYLPHESIPSITKIDKEPPESHLNNRMNTEYNSAKPKKHFWKYALGGAFVLTVIVLILISLGVENRPEFIASIHEEPEPIVPIPEEPEPTPSPEPIPPISEQQFDQVNTIRPDVIESLANTGRRRLLTYSELDNLSIREVKLVRNHFYAFYNRPFNTAWIRSYYQQNLSGYRPNSSNYDPTLTDTEKDNVNLIVEYEADRGITNYSF